ESEVVELEEGLAAAEIEDRECGGVGRTSVLVEGERVLLEDKAHLVRTVLLLDAVEGRVDPAAEGALEIAEFNDGDGGVRVTPGRIFGRYGDDRLLVGRDGGAPRRRRRLCRDLQAATAID